MKKARRDKTPARAETPAKLKTVIAVLLALAGLTAAIYWQAAGFELTNLDDNDYVTENPHVTSGLTWENVRWAFTTNHASNWHPLTWLSLMLDAEIGRETEVYHATNIVLHVLSVVLLCLVLYCATGMIWPSAFAAGLFGVHPLHVESVAWVAERKDVLSTFLLMLALLAYVRLINRSRARGIALTALFAAAGLLAKPMLVSLPVVLMLLDVWPLRRYQPMAAEAGARSALVRLTVEKWPLFALAAASCCVTLWAQATGGAVRTLEAYPFGVRLANAMVSYVGYIGKAVWPSRLAVFYPHPGDTLPSWQVMLSGVAVAAATILAVRLREKAPYLLVGWLWYVITLVPVVGVVQVGDQAMADRYTYVPLIGVFVAAAWALQGVSVKAPMASFVFGAAVLTASSCAAYRQVGFWQSSEALFGRALSVTTDNALAHNNLGSVLLNKLEFGPSGFDRAQYDRVVEHFREAVRLHPNYPEALYNLATALAKGGSLDEALPLFNNALKISPGTARVHNNFGLALMNLGEFTRAEDEFRAALALEPNMVEAHNNLGRAFYRQGRYADALAPLKQALDIRPDYAQAHSGLGDALLRLQRNGEAVEHYLKAIELEPGRAAVHNNLAVAYERLGRREDALRQLEAALRADPDNPAIIQHYRALSGSPAQQGFSR